MRLWTYWIWQESPIRPILQIFPFNFAKPPPYFDIVLVQKPFSHRDILDTRRKVIRSQQGQSVPLLGKELKPEPFQSHLQVIADDFMAFESGLNSLFKPEREYPFPCNRPSLFPSWVPFYYESSEALIRVIAGIRSLIPLTAHHPGQSSDRPHG